MNSDPAIPEGTRSFPSTVWSDLLSAADPESPACRTKLEHLMRMYWRPVFAYVRAAGHKSAEDSKDITQSFLARMLEKDALAKLRPERGSFRGFLKRSVKNFLVDHERAQAARKPPGTTFSLDAQVEDLERITPASPEEPPDRAYDREWFRSLFASAIDDLRKQLYAEGKRVYFEVFRIYCIDPADSADASRKTTLDGGRFDSAPTYAEIAKKLALKETDVTNYLNHCRTAARKLLRARVRDYVGSDEEIDRELQEAAAG